VPSGAVLQIFQPGNESVGSVAGTGEVVEVQGGTYGLFRLDEIFGTGGRRRPPGEMLAVLTEVNRERKAFLVDDVVGEQQVVVRDFQGFRKRFDLNLFSGVALLGELTGIVLDMERLFREADRNGRSPA
jgi:two-component system chemotaxis sensor kinase CheA